MQTDEQTFPLDVPILDPLAEHSTSAGGPGVSELINREDQRESLDSTQLTNRHSDALVDRHASGQRVDDVGSHVSQALLGRLQQRDTRLTVFRNYGGSPGNFEETRPSEQKLKVDQLMGRAPIFGTQSSAEGSSQFQQLSREQPSAFNNNSVSSMRQTWIKQ